jgi:hypothetical protein
MDEGSKLVSNFAYLTGQTPGSRLGVLQSMNGHIVPVVKNILIGPRGGAYYINQRGRIVYLDRGQKHKCLNGYMVGDKDGVCKRMSVHTNDDTEPASFNGMKRLKKYGGLYKK